MKKTIKVSIKLVILLFAVSLITFILVEASPIDPIASYVGAEKTISQEQRLILEEKWGLNDPVPIRYIKWIKSVLTGDMGESHFYHKPVLTVIKNATSNTLLLMLTSWLLSGILGFGLGIISAANKGKLIDGIIKKFCYLLSSTPLFWFGMLMLLVFSVWLKIFPVALSLPIGKTLADVTFGERLYHIVLPAITLSLVGISNITLHTREKLIEVLNSDYALFAKARGESKWTCIRKHGIRNILLPAITLQFGSISELFGGSVLVENVFSYAGLGNITIVAGTKGDIPLLLGITLIATVFVFVGNLCANILYPIVDPRIREGS